jgi:S-DNA-T family DNA segregation ATPase FtsK/SpoIIIE
MNTNSLSGISEPDEPTGGKVLAFPHQTDAAEPTVSSGDVIDADAGDEVEDGDTDRESVAIVRPAAGRPVDPPDGQDMSTGSRTRRPIIPPWLRSRSALRAAMRWAVGQSSYTVAFHTVRVPKYLSKVAVYAPLGGARVLVRVLRWATAEEGNYALRQAAASNADPQTWLRLDLQRQREARWRWAVLSVSVVCALLGLAIAATIVPAFWWWFVAVTVVFLLARAGRPGDKPITDRVMEGAVYRKLTADLVRRALLSVQLGAINSAVSKDPNAITFPVEIHRDGPGHLAIVDLPFGVEAGDVCGRRGRLASGLRLPLDQVWPEPAPGHTGRLALWVGYEPASQMRQPAWPLLRDGQVDVFKPCPFATDPRMNVIDAELIYRNWLFGGQPGSGKTFALRLLVLVAALDARAEIRGYELKGVGDFAVVEPVCAEYGNGFDDETLARCAAMFDWLYAECERRSKRIAHYARLGKAPENKVTPELASLNGSGLHPLVVFVDEIQELFLSKHGKEAAEVAEKVIKLGRALGVVLLLGTQIPDKDSLPTGITRNINTRFCLSVADQVANDMILGTSAYKLGYRATVFEPGTEAGWGILAGMGKPGARRSFYVDNAHAQGS